MKNRVVATFLNRRLKMMWLDFLALPVCGAGLVVNALGFVSLTASHVALGRSLVEPRTESRAVSQIRRPPGHEGSF